MAKGWQELDMGFPTFSGEESPKQMVAKIHDYLFRAKQGLKITFQDLEVNLEKLQKENATLMQRIEEMQKTIQS